MLIIYVINKCCGGFLKDGVLLHKELLKVGIQSHVRIEHFRKGNYLNTIITEDKIKAGEGYIKIEEYGIIINTKDINEIFINNLINLINKKPFINNIEKK